MNNDSELIFENYKSIYEAVISGDDRDELDDLITDYYGATDPDADYAGYEPGDDEIILQKIRAKFGDRIAQQLEDGSYKMHFGRDNNQGYYLGGDKLGDKGKMRVTAKGKLNATDVKVRKQDLKRGKFK